MSRQHMAQRISLLLVLVFAVVSLGACGTGKVTAPTYQYDASKYAICSQLDGVQFLVPRSLDDGKEEMANYSVYNADDLHKHSFENLTENNYVLFKPDDYACYAFYTGNLDHVEGERDVTRIASLTGISNIVTFESREGDSFQTRTDQATGYIRNTFPVIIHDQERDLDWYGYLTLLKNPDNGRNYLFADGFAKEGQEKLAKYFANSFVLTDQ